MIHIKNDYLKRVSSRTTRLERLEYKIGPGDCSATRILDELSTILNIIRADDCTILVFNSVVDLGIALTLRI